MTALASALATHCHVTKRQEMTRTNRTKTAEAMRNCIAHLMKKGIEIDTAGQKLADALTANDQDKYAEHYETAAELIDDLIRIAAELQNRIDDRV